MSSLLVTGLKRRKKNKNRALVGYLILSPRDLWGGRVWVNERAEKKPARRKERRRIRPWISTSTPERPKLFVVSATNTPSTNTHHSNHAANMASALAWGTGVAVAAFLVRPWEHAFGRNNANNLSTGPGRSRGMAAIARRRRRNGQGLLQGRFRAQDEQERGCARPLTQVSATTSLDGKPLC